MIFEIENLGILKKVKIDLSKNLTILCGQNNTGKTYISYGIYGFFKFTLQHEFILKVIPTLNLNSILDELFTKKKIEIDLFDLFILNYKKVFKSISKLYLKKLNNVLGVDSSFISKTKFSIQPKEAKKTDFKDYIFQYTEMQRRTSPEIDYELLKVKNNGKVTIEIKSIDNKNVDNKKLMIDVIENFFISMVWKYLFIKPTFMFPAERIAINVFSKELSIKRSKLIDELAGITDHPMDLIKRRTSRYPLAISDNLELSEDLDIFQKNFSKYSYIADEIEKLLNGKIIISEHGQMKFNPSNNGNVNLDIHLTGSSVKSLASLVFYFRHLANKGDFLIIDEPELTLHPDNQKKIARIIARIVNAGFKVMISTHSDYIIRELNNLIMLKSNEKKAANLMDKYGYLQSELLNFQEINAYLFDKNEALNIEVDKTGFEVLTIDSAISELNVSAEDIYFSLFD